jgi:hypothetical protein
MLLLRAVQQDVYLASSVIARRDPRPSCRSLRFGLRRSGTGRPQRHARVDLRLHTARHGDAAGDRRRPAARADPPARRHHARLGRRRCAAATGSAVVGARREGPALRARQLRSARRHARARPRSLTRVLQLALRAPNQATRRSRGTRRIVPHRCRVQSTSSIAPMAEPSARYSRSVFGSARLSWRGGSLSRIQSAPAS